MNIWLKPRKYIAQRAELLGAIRLPSDTFKGNAGTEVVSDILFLQKRDRLIDIEPDWVHLDADENGIRMNSYFVQHPEMILGEMKMVSGRFGQEATCEPFENADLSELLNEAVSNIHGEISEYEVADELEEEDNSIPADPEVRNFSYTVLDDKIYFRENSRMSPVEVSATAENRIKGMIGIRDCVRNLIELQTEDYSDSEIKQAQQKLNTLYDSFTKKYGLINSRANTSAFSDDSSYALLSALEVINEEGELERKADMFFKRTIVFLHSFTLFDRLLSFGNDSSLIDFTEFKSLNDSLNFGSVLSSCDNIHRNIIAIRVFIPEYTVENTVAFCLLGKFLQVLIRDREHFKFLTRLNHIGQSGFAFCFLFLFENRD